MVYWKKDYIKGIGSGDNMIYERHKDDFIFSLRYEDQTLYYFDDSLFEGEEPSNKVNKDSICKISEIADYIEEFSAFFDVGYFTYDGLLKIDYKRENYDEKDLPTICNSRNEATKFHTKFIKHRTTEGKEFFDSRISIVIDLSKSFDEIMSDLKNLEEFNDSFSSEELFEIIGIKSIKNFKEYISAERIFMLEKEEYAFIMMEYCQLRKYMKLSKESAQLCLKKIYNFEKDS